MIVKKCLQCKKRFKVFPCRRGMFDTKECAYLFRRGKQLSEKTKKKMSKTAKAKGFGKWMKGRSGKLSPRWKEDKPRCVKCNTYLKNYKYKHCSKHHSFLKGEGSTAWKGDNIGYHGIHRWMNKTFGKAKKCENLDCLYRPPKSFEWALLEGMKYERKRENFIQLCIGCHRKYDNNFKHIVKNFNIRT